MCFGVADGARTHDNRNHNPGLYQLSYSHHRPKSITDSAFDAFAMRSTQGAFVVAATEAEAATSVLKRCLSAA